MLTMRLLAGAKRRRHLKRSTTASKPKYNIANWTRLCRTSNATARVTAAKGPEWEWSFRILRAHVYIYQREYKKTLEAAR